MELSGSNIFLKNSLYLRKRSFFIFQEMEALKNLFMFLEVTFWVQKIKKINSEKISCISANGTLQPQS